MDQLDIEKFDPTTAELTAMVEATKNITITDLKDKEQLEIVHTNRINLKKARVSIEKKGKELRETAVAFQKAVITKEKELIAIIEPEEDRLAAIEEEAKQAVIREERERKLPERRERLTALGWTPGTSEDVAILGMDDVEFETLVSNVKARIEAEEQARIRSEQAAKQAELDARQEEIEAKERAIREKEEATERERNRQAEIEQARLEGERKAKEEIERKEVAKKAEEERKAKEAKAEMEKLEKRKKYIAFLTSHGWTEETKDDFKTEETVSGYVLYKKLGVFNK